MLAYDQSPDREPRLPESPPRTGTMSLSLFDLLQILWRRRTAIAATAAGCALVALLVGKSLSPKYTATAQLYVDPRELQLVDRELSPRAQDATNLPMIVDSQARLLTSSSVLLRVVDTAKLADDPEFGGGQSTGVLKLLARMIGFGVSSPGSNDARTGAFEALARHVNVRRTDRSFIVDVEVWSKEPAKAAMLATAVANAYLSEASDVQAGAARRATADLSGRLSELEERLRAAENRVAAYKAENNFVGTQDAVISDQQLSEANARLSAARAATLDAQARYDQITAAIRASEDGGAISEALRSPTLAGLRAQYAEARRRRAELENELGPRHPAIRSMETQVGDLKKNINEEIARFTQSAKNDLIRARDYEGGLAKALDALKRQSVDMSQASVRLRELERDVEANRAVYQAFLKRSRETEEQERLNTSSARITSEAIVPQHRSFPPSMALLMMVGLLFGALAASALAVLLDRLKPAGMPPKPSAPVEPPPVARDDRQPSLAMASSELPRLAPVAKPAIAWLRQSDLAYRGHGDRRGPLDLGQIGWPALRVGVTQCAFTEAMRGLRVAAAARSSMSVAPVLVAVSPREDASRSVGTLNVALAAAQDGIDVLLVDAGFRSCFLSRQVAARGDGSAAREEDDYPSGLGEPVETINGVTVLPISEQADPAIASESMCAIIDHARRTTECGIVIVDGPSIPFAVHDGALLEIADGVIAVLPADLEVDKAMEEVISALRGSERKLLGVVLTELDRADVLKDLQYA